MIENLNGQRTDALPSNKLQIPTKHKRNRTRRRRVSVPSEVWRFLNTDPANATRVMGLFRPDDIPQIHQAIDLVFPKILIKRVTEWTHDDKPSNWGPHFQLFDMADGESKLLMTAGVLFCEWPPEFPRLIIIVRPIRGRGMEECVLVELIAPPGLQFELKQKFNELRGQVQSLPHFLKGQLIDCEGCPISKPVTRIVLDDVALPERTRTLIRQNTVDLILDYHRYKQWKIPLTRGILLHGPPGNGKTMIGRALAGMDIATFIQVNPENLSRDGFKPVFKMARRLAPTILFFEDLDFVAGSKFREHGSARLAELLVQMDGLERNDGLIVIATTNELEMLDSAVKGRPNRFDVVLEIGLPEFAARHSILGKQLAGLASPDVIHSAAELTDGLSGAQVKETAIHACQLAVQTGLEPLQLLLSHIEKSLESLYQVRRPKPLGFHVNGNAT